MASIAPATPSLTKLVEALASVSARWYELGIAFGFIPNDLNGIKRGKPQSSVDEWMTDMLHMKMNRSPDFGWSDVTRALGKIGCGALAETIQREYCPQESNVALSRLIEKNESKLRVEFGALLDQSCDELEAKVPANKFRTFAKGVFSPANYIGKSEDVREMLDAITDQNGWNYQHHTSLEMILCHFKISDEKLQEYNQLLSHFNVTTKIKDWIEKNNLDKKQSHDSPAPLLPHDCVKLSAKLSPHTVTEKSLQYVQDLWKDITNCLLQLPNLDAVLYDIEKGCVLITWLIPATINAATRIRNRVHICEDIFTKWEIVELMVNEECIYPEQQVVTAPPPVAQQKEPSRDEEPQQPSRETPPSVRHPPHRRRTMFASMSNIFLRLFRPLLRPRQADISMPVEQLASMSVRYGMEPLSDTSSSVQSSSRSIPSSNARPIFRQLQQLESSSGRRVKIIESTAPKFRRLADTLNVPPAIESTAEDDNASCEMVLRRWMSDPNARRPVTWGTLVHALRDTDFSDLAREVELVLTEGIMY